MKFFKKLIASLLGLGLLLTFIFLCWCVLVFRDRNPGYKVDLDIPAEQGSSQVRVGFAKAKINPDLSLGPVYLAGFSQDRKATAIHDDIWAVAFVVDDGKTRVGVVALDAIGFFHDEVIAVRKRIPAEAKIDYAIVCSTHNHSTPDLMGLWGPNYTHTGVDESYRELVISQAAAALAAAATNLQPARVKFHQIKTAPDGLVADSRKPEVFDPDLRVMHFVKPGSTNTIGSLVTWGNHPETPWSKNTEVTADFCGVLRDGLEKALGGTHCYINGAIGGLMTTSPSVTVKDPVTGQEFKEPSHEKTKALGEQLLSKVLPAMTGKGGTAGTNLSWDVKAKTILLPVQNKVFLAASVLRLIDRGHTGFRNIRSEVAMLTLGQASFVCIPGEIYPEIVNGGIESPPGADYPGKAVETPPIREFMPGEFKFILGLANDEVGYIIPRTEWDEDAPYLYEGKKAPYGEINSLGPDTAEVIHQALLQMAQPKEAGAP